MGGEIIAEAKKSILKSLIFNGTIIFSGLNSVIHNIPHNSQIKTLNPGGFNTMVFHIIKQDFFNVNTKKCFTMTICSHTFDNHYVFGES